MAKLISHMEKILLMVNITSLQKHVHALIRTISSCKMKKLQMNSFDFLSLPMRKSHR